MSSGVSFPRWTLVRGFGSIKYFNISYGVLFAIPIVYELHDKLASVISWFGYLLSFSASLKWVYAASFSYTIAIAIYQLFCPSEIKRFERASDYILDQFEIFHRASPHHRLAIVLARLDSTVDAVVISRIEALRELVRQTSEGKAQKQEAESELNALLDTLNADSVQRYLANAFDQKDRSKRVARWISFLLYCTGSMILAGLLLVRSYRVLCGT